MTQTERKPVTVEVLGSLVFHLSSEFRDGLKARALVWPGVTLEQIPKTLGIPANEIKAFLVNGKTISDHSYILRPGDQVLIEPKEAQ